MPLTDPDLQGDWLIHAGVRWLTDGVRVIRIGYISEQNNTVEVIVTVNEEIKFS